MLRNRSLPNAPRLRLRQLGGSLWPIASGAPIAPSSGVTLFNAREPGCLVPGFGGVSAAAATAGVAAGMWHGVSRPASGCLHQRSLDPRRMSVVASAYAGPRYSRPSRGGGYASVGLLAGRLCSPSPSWGSSSRSPTCRGAGETRARDLPLPPPLRRELAVVLRETMAAAPGSPLLLPALIVEWLATGVVAGYAAAIPFVSSTLATGPAVSQPFPFL